MDAESVVVFVVIAYAGTVGYYTYQANDKTEKLTKENAALIQEVRQLKENHQQIHANLKAYAQGVEQVLNDHKLKLEQAENRLNITQGQLGSAKAIRDPESNAVVWE